MSLIDSVHKAHAWMKGWRLNEWKAACCKSAIIFLGKKKTKPCSVVSKIAEATEAFSFLVLFYYYSHFFFFFFELHIRQDDTERALQNPPGGSRQLALSFGGSCPLLDESCHWIIWKAYIWPLQQQHFWGGGKSVSNSPPPFLHPQMVTGVKLATLQPSHPAT